MLLQEMIKDGMLSVQAVELARLLNREVDSFTKKPGNMDRNLERLIRSGETQERFYVKRWLQQKEGYDHLLKLLAVSRNMYLQLMQG